MGRLRMGVPVPGDLVARFVSEAFGTHRAQPERALMVP